MPASAVPVMVSVGSLVSAPFVSGPVSSGTSSDTEVIDGVAGAWVSSITVKPLEATLWLPAASVALAVSVWLPSPSAEVVIVNEPPVATPVPSTVVPSVS